VPSHPSILVYIFGFLRPGTTVESVGAAGVRLARLGWGVLECSVLLPGWGDEWNVTSRWRRLSFSEINPPSCQCL
jgi:hypothetical protein